LEILTLARSAPTLRAIFFVAVRAIQSA